MTHRHTLPAAAATLALTSAAAGVFVLAEPSASSSPPTSSLTPAQLHRAHVKGFDKPLVDGGSTLRITGDGPNPSKAKTLLTIPLTAKTPVLLSAVPTNLKHPAYHWEGSYLHSTPKGCNWVIIDNRARTILGAFAWRLTTRQHFCHRRHKKVVSHVRRSWDVKLTDFEAWDKWIWNRFNYFSHIKHYPRSGFRGDREAQIINSVPVYGTWKVNHPINKIHVYSNGDVWASIDR